VTRRRLAARVVLACAAIVVALGIAEVVFRLAGLYLPHPRTYVGESKNAESKNYAPEAPLGWRQPRNARYTVNESGRDILYAADENGFRIAPDAPPPKDPRHLITVGDSFTFGTGVAAADAWPAVLAGMLGGWKLTNLAQPGYAVDQIWQSLVLEGLPRKPDLVVAGIYPEDLERSLSAYRVHMNKPAFRLDSGRLVPLTEKDTPGFVTRFLEAHSRVFTLARQIEVNAGFRFGIGGVWNLNAAMFDDMIRACREAGVPIVFVHIPWPTLEPFEAFGASMQKKGALAVDPIEAMKARHEVLYLDNGRGHLNDAGHRLIAAEIAAFLRGHPEAIRGRTR
jgi:hypothetical protein